MRIILELHEVLRSLLSIGRGKVTGQSDHRGMQSAINGNVGPFEWLLCIREGVGHATIPNRSLQREVEICTRSCAHLRLKVPI